MTMTIKKILLALALSVTALAMLAEAQAKPLGGGRSFGRQSSNVTRQSAAPAPTQAAPRPAAAPAPTPAPAPAIPPKPASPWKGILGGALLGLGAGALLSHFGMGGAMGGMLGSLLMIGLLAMAGLFIFRMVRGKSAGGNPAPFQGGFQDHQPLAQGAGATPEIGSGLQRQAFEPLPPASSGVALDKPQAAPAQWGVPADFDSAAFLRHAKTNFIRLQAAWDKADVEDIREFTTPEVFAELKMQIQERGGNADFTDVVSIDGELLGIETAGNEYLASVKFKGMIRSAPGAAPEPFSEVWNLAKPMAGNGGWLLAGIQQLS
jgi:predicted lipid-binding transport protein (Tim44 family)